MPYTAGPFDSQHVYVQWGGKLPGNEQWSCGLRFYNTTGSPLTNDPTWLAAVKTAIQAYHVSTSSYISGAAKLSFVKGNVIGTDGLYVSQNTEQVIVADVAGGGAATPPHPNQIALAISLTTGFSRGPAHRGRFYMPLPMFLPAADGLISVTDQGFARTSAQTLLAALNAITANLQVGVFSRKVGAAGHRAVTGIQVGRALDTQRRRRRSLVEGY